MHPNLSNTPKRAGDAVHNRWHGSKPAIIVDSEAEPNKFRAHHRSKPAVQAPRTTAETALQALLEDVTLPERALQTQDYEGYKCILGDDFARSHFELIDEAIETKRRLYALIEADKDEQTRPDSEMRAQIFADSLAHIMERQTKQDECLILVTHKLFVAMERLYSQTTDGKLSIFKRFFGL